ncbi:Cell division protein FtsQ, partial [Trichinella spiralis]
GREVFISPDNRYTHETVEKVLPGSLPWQKIGSMACIPMAVKDQGAASDDTHGNAQCSELSAKSLTHHNFFKHKNICEKLKQAEMDPMNSWHMTCLTQAYLLLAQQSTLSVFIRFITSSTWAFMQVNSLHMLNWGSEGISSKSCRRNDEKILGSRAVSDCLRRRLLCKKLRSVEEVSL